MEVEIGHSRDSILPAFEMVFEDISPAFRYVPDSLTINSIPQYAPPLLVPDPSLSNSSLRVEMPVFPFGNDKILLEYTLELRQDVQAGEVVAPTTTLTTTSAPSTAEARVDAHTSVLNDIYIDLPKGLSVELVEEAAVRAGLGVGDVIALRTRLVLMHGGQELNLTIAPFVQNAEAEILNSTVQTVGSAIAGGGLSIGDLGTIIFGSSSSNSSNSSSSGGVGVVSHLYSGLVINNGSADGNLIIDVKDELVIETQLRITRLTGGAGVSPNITADVFWDYGSDSHLIYANLSVGASPSVLIGEDSDSDREKSTAIVYPSNRTYCAGNCGNEIEYGIGKTCWCDDACFEYGDCCPDFIDICKIPKLYGVSPRRSATEGGVPSTLTGKDFGSNSDPETEEPTPSKPQWARLEFGGNLIPNSAVSSWTDAKITWTVPPGQGA